MKEYTVEDDRIINQEVINNPMHLRDAFAIAAKKINRTPSAVCTRYYNYILKRKDLNQMVNTLSTGLENANRIFADFKKESDNEKRFSLIFELKSEMELVHKQTNLLDKRLKDLLC